MLLKEFRSSQHAHLRVAVEQYVLVRCCSLGAQGCLVGRVRRIGVRTSVAEDNSLLAVGELIF